MVTLKLERFGKGFLLLMPSNFPDSENEKNIACDLATKVLIPFAFDVAHESDEREFYFYPQHADIDEVVTWLNITLQLGVNNSGGVTFRIIYQP